MNVPVTGSADWANPGYITADDTNYASANLSGSILTSGYLEGVNYGFAIPSNATITGIVVTIGRHESGRSSSFDVRDSTVRLLKDGVMTGSNKAATGTEWPTTPPVAASYGTPVDLWGTTWTPEEINSSNFGVALSVITNVNRIAYVDYMQISVTYTVTMVASNTTVNCGSGTPVVTYGSDITCVATVVRGSGSKTPTGNVNWTTNGSGGFITSPCVLAGSAGTATCSVTYSPSSVGTGSHLITATYAGDPDFFSSTGDQTVTVNPKLITITPGAGQTKVFGAVDPTFTYTSSDPAATFTGALGRVAGEIVGTYAYTLGSLDAGTNYTLGMVSSPATFSITPATSTHSISLVPGWNLVSFTVHPEDTSIATVLSSISGNYDLVYAWDAMRASNNWLIYDPSMPPFLNSLTLLDETMGFWIHMTAADTLEVTGMVPVTTTIQLYTNGGG